MKSLFFTFLTLSSFCFSQNRYVKLSEISVVTENRDTLFLMNDDLGRNIYQLWQEEYSKTSKRSTAVLLVRSLPPARSKKPSEFYLEDK
jgi:hypothetical protein